MASERPRRRAACVALLAAGVLTATVARAEPTAADRETARSLMQQGRELREKGDGAEALKRFKAADDIMHVPTTGLELAKAQVAQGLLVEARDTIATHPAVARQGVGPRALQGGTPEGADQLDASLNGRVPALTIVVKGAGPGESATVTVDGIALAETAVGLPRSVDPGHHVLVAKTPTGEGKAEVDVAEGDQKKVEIAMVSSAPPPPAETPAETPPATETPEAEPTRSHAPTTLTWIGIGVGGAGLVAGSVAGILSISKKSSLDSACANNVCGPSSYSDLDSANSLAMVSNVAFAVAGAGAALAIVSLIVGHEESSAPASQAPPAEAVRWVPWVGAGSAGVSGTF